MNEDGTFAAFHARVRQSTEGFLARSFDSCGETTVCQAARYASMNGGHRWRAVATIAAGTMFRPDPLGVCLPSACATELAHTASLILDDLPSMDDATIRRGRPCVHLVYPRWAVDMVPPFLVTLAFGISLDNPLAADERRLATVAELSRAGLKMARGQEGDVTQPADATTEEALIERHRLKTGALFGAAAASGAILGGAGPDEARTLRNAGEAIGIAYQIADDVADREARPEDVAKTVRRDGTKVTIVDILGSEGAARRAGRYRQEALDALACYGPEAGLFRSLVLRACCVDR